MLFNKKKAFNVNIVISFCLLVLFLITFIYYFLNDIKFNSVIYYLLMCLAVLLIVSIMGCFYWLWQLLNQQVLNNAKSSKIIDEFYNELNRNINCNLDVLYSNEGIGYLTAGYSYLDKNKLISIIESLNDEQKREILEYSRNYYNKLKIYLSEDINELVISKYIINELEER